jgi:hypothetical protein
MVVPTADAMGYKYIAPGGAENKFSNYRQITKKKD